MKTYEETAASALARIHEHQRKKKRIVAAGGAALAAAAALGIVLIPRLGSGEHIPQSSEAAVSESRPQSVTSHVDHGKQEPSAQPAESAAENDLAENSSEVQNNERYDIYISTDRDPSSEEREKRTLISSYPVNRAEDWPVPGKGECFLSYGLESAIGDYGGGYIYQVLVEMWDGNEPVRSRDAMLAEADRLYREGGITTAVEEITYPDGGKKNQLYLLAEDQQVLDFPASDKYGYILSLYNDNST